MERLIDPVVGDLQAEYASAIGIRRRWLALCAGYIALAKVLLWCGLLGTREAWSNWNAEDQRGLNRLLQYIAVTTVFATSIAGLPDVLRLPDMLSFNPNANARLERLVLYLVPSALALGVPAGLAIGAALGAATRIQSRRVITVICLVAVLSSVASFVNIAWVTPHANQSFREELVGRFPERGINELALTELRTSPKEAFVFHVRLALAVAPLTFAIFGIVVATRRWRWSIAVTIACTAVVIFVVALSLGRTLVNTRVLPPPVAAWLPLLLVAYATILIGWLAAGRRTEVTPARA
jgi:lipopolysaccharide export LptBFGC system permease protein LptF